MGSKVNNVSSAAFADTKPHYNLLDGLRGAAALMVIWYHVFEGYAFAEGMNSVEGGGLINVFNHGYLAVDFFFILSGFVISYAYDDRWNIDGNNRLTLGKFFKRRLIRLHPMLVMGAVIGAVCFLIQGGVKWDGSSTALSWVMVALLLSILFVPAYPGAAYDVRGNGEMFSLNGPSWSLFFEYIGNICYALFIRKMSDNALKVWVFISGMLLALYAIMNVSGYESIGVGWTLDAVNFFGGFLRMIFPFSLGMLIARNFKPVRIKGIFWISIVALFALFSVPFFASWNGVCINGVYEMLCVMVAFPAIVWLAASGTTTDSVSSRVCNFLGDISYPVYIVHYPIMYLFYSWLIEKQIYTLSESWLIVIGVFVLNITLAYVCLKLYDEPVRRWLAKRFVK